MEESYKEVYFHEYCKSCKHKDKLEGEYPCHDCLNEPVNVYSHKPVSYEPADGKHVEKKEKRRGR